MDALNSEGLSFAEVLQLDGVEEELELRRPVGICAFHGGNLERETDRIARDAATQSDSSFYAVTQPKGMRHHVPSAQVKPEDSEALRSFLNHCEVVIAIHGYGRHDQWTTLQLGGRNRVFAAHIAHHLRWHLPAYKIRDKLEEIPRELRGQHPDNPCNLSVGGGVQIELPPRVRGLSPIALHWPGHDWQSDPFPHSLDLIHGLANAARTWATSGQ